MTVVFATCDQQPLLSADDQLLADALVARGVEVTPIPWTEIDPFAVAYAPRTLSMVLFWPVGGARYRIAGHQRFAEHLAHVKQNGLAAVVELAKEGKAFGADPRGGPWVSVLRHDPDFAELRSEGLVVSPTHGDLDEATSLHREVGVLRAYDVRHVRRLLDLGRFERDHDLDAVVAVVARRRAARREQGGFGDRTRGDACDGRAHAARP